MPELRLIMIRHTVACLVLVGVVLGFAPLPSLAQEASEVDAATKRLTAAHGLFQRGRFRDAVAKYEEFLKHHDRHDRATEARYGLGLSQYRLKQYEQAVDTLEAVVKNGNFDQRPAALAVRGHSQMMLDRHEQALGSFEELLRRHGKSDHADMAAMGRVQALYLMGRHDKALEAAEAFLRERRSSPRRAAAMYYRGLAQTQLKQHEAAAASFDGLLKEYQNSPFDLDARLALGQNLQRLGKLDEAVKAYRDLLAAAPPDRRAEARYVLGAAEQRRGRHKEAIEQLSAVLKEHESSPYAEPARLQLGLAQMNAGELDAAVKSFRHVEKHDEQRRVNARYYLARIDMKREAFEAARNQLQQLMKLNDQTPGYKDLADRIAYQHAVAEQKLERFKEAAGHFEQFLQRHKESDLRDQARYQWAFSLHRTKDYQRSIEVLEPFKNHEARSPLWRAAHELLAENRFLLGQYEEADKVYARLIEATDDEDRAWAYRYRRGQAAFFRDDMKTAIDRLKLVVDHKGFNDRKQLHRAVFLLGDAYLQRGENAPAAEALGRYLNLTEGLKPEARLKLGLAHLRRDKRDEARQTFARVAEGETASPWVQRALLELGRLLYDAGDAKAAGEALSKLIKTEADASLKAPATYLLGWIDFDAERYGPAAQRFAEVVEKHADHDLASDALYQQAVALRRAGNDEQALSKLRRYLERHGEGEHAARARYLVGVSLAEGGDYGGAIEMLKPLAEDKDARTDAVMFDLAWSYRRAEQAEAAERTLRALLKAFPKSDLAPDAKVELGELLYQREAYKESVEQLTEALGQEAIDDATKLAAMYRLGWAHKKQDQHLEAAGAFRRFADTYGDHELRPSALYQAGETFAAGGKKEDARKAFAELVDKHRDNELIPTALIRYGQVVNELGAHDQAANAFERYLKEHKDGEYAYLAEFGIGWSLEQRQKYDDARQWYQRVTEDHNGPTAARAQMQIGETYFAEGRHEDAIRELVSVDIVYDAPQWASLALYEAGRAAEAAKKPAEARKFYEEVIEKYPDTTAAADAKARLAKLAGAG